MGVKFSTGRDQLRHYKEFMDQWDKKDERYHQVTKLLSLQPPKPQKSAPKMKRKELNNNKNGNNSTKKNDRAIPKQNEFGIASDTKSLDTQIAMFCTEKATENDTRLNSLPQKKREEIGKQSPTTRLDMRAEMFCTEKRSEDGTYPNPSKQRQSNTSSVVRRTSKWAWPGRRRTVQKKYSPTTDEEQMAEEPIGPNPFQRQKSSKRASVGTSRRSRRHQVRRARPERRSTAWKKYSVTTSETDGEEAVVEFTQLENISSIENDTSLEDIEDNDECDV